MPRKPRASPSTTRVAGTVLIMISWPSRLIIKERFFAADARKIGVISSQSIFLSPFTPMISSPGRIPALFAGEIGSFGVHSALFGTHGTTCETVGRTFETPTPAKRMKSNKKPRTKWRNDPAPSTTNFWEVFAL